MEAELLDIQNMHNVGATASINLVDETGGNSSSVLVVATSHRFSDVSIGEVTMDRGGSTGIVANSFDSAYTSNIGSAIYLFDLGNVTGGESITLNNVSTGTARETFTVFQLSGVDLSAVQFVTGAHNGNVFSSAFTEDLDAGSFTLWTAANRSNRSLDAVIPTVTSTPPSEDFNSLVAAAGGNHSVYWAYDNGLSGTTSVGFDLSSDGATSLVGVNLVAIPEPGTLTLVGIAGIGLLAALRRRKA